MDNDGFLWFLYLLIVGKLATIEGVLKPIFGNNIMTISHKFFGELDFSKLNDTDVIWEKDIEFNNQTIDVALWANDESKFNQQNLDKYANVIKNLADFDKLARNHLIESLNEDNFFIIHHLEEIEIDESEIIKGLGENPSVAEFVKAMTILSISLWQQDSTEECAVVFDYMIDPENSDQILAVKFDIDGNFLEVAWES